MTELVEQLLRRITKDLAEADVKFAVVGGIAISARAEPRFTRDVDIALGVQSDEQAEEVLGYLIRCGYRPFQELNHDITGRLATMRMIPPSKVEYNLDEGDPPVDIICSSCGIEPEVVEAATETPIFKGCIVPTANLPHLIAMKLLSESDARIQDRTDLQYLIATSEPADLQLVPHLLDLIIERGYSREKDLHGSFRHYVHRNENRA